MMTRQLQQPHAAKVISIVVFVFTFTSTLSIVLRFVGKKIQKLSLSAEDVLIIAALVSPRGPLRGYRHDVNIIRLRCTFLLQI